MKCLWPFPPKAVLATGNFPRTTKSWEDRDVTLKTWVARETKYSRAHNKHELRIRAADDGDRFGSAIVSISDAKLMLVVGPGILGFSGNSRLQSDVSVFPGFGGTREVACGEYGFGGNGHKHFIGDGQLSSHVFQLGFLVFYVLGDAS